MESQLRENARETPYRSVAVSSVSPRIEQRGDCWYIEATDPLGSYPTRLTERLASGAEAHPDRLLVARRDSNGVWRGISYGQMAQDARAIGQALRDRGLSEERPLVILSGNSLEHLQLALGAMWAGIPYAPISPAYSLISGDYGKLRHVLSTLTPGLVFADEIASYTAALDATLASDVERVSVTSLEGGSPVTSFASLLNTKPRDVDTAHESIDGDTVAKFLFTSGSTRLPKVVPTTHRMLCSNQEMLLETFPEFGKEPPVLVDWLPWNHTFGGSHNLGIALYNGGTIYIDDGKPVPGKFEETLRNLREIAPTIYFNVPKGWEELTIALESDATLRERFFSSVKMYFFAGAGLSKAAWERLERVTLKYCGERIRIMAGLGMTETAPSCLFTTGPFSGAGYIGLPAPGCMTKLVPVDGKLEVRFRGPNVMRGYWRASPEQTKDVFDDEGYYRTGDAVRFVDAARPEIGLSFDGRIAEDFKLGSGTFVSVGPMRARIISEGAPYVQDAVITGMNRDDVGAMLFPRVDACRTLAGLGANSTAKEVLNAPSVRAYFTELAARLNSGATGSSTYIARLRILTTPPSLDKGEITDKGSINQRAVLQHRAHLVEAMYANDGADPEVIYTRRKN
ncbi:feruloyl-CoA synthase [Paraburkholderia fynbosensis]|uniref:2-succinylbenzoate--CoA ligase n=1 Tax=Paraburkholderia fynbosensis TaxID=1200993 RepID=A0A6J5GU38_9BURK|nr:feruloyl-CoA synthase [Paraburkholderia fynbosensis]CAB3807062.1 2-succinylbenzoate--CoA ligase [Paraburkholderia fynbosensis]